MSRTSLDETIVRLDEIIAEGRDAGSAFCVFPAMYRSVTAAVRGAVRAGGFFDDDSVLEELTVVFADRYIDAYDKHRSGIRPAECWAVAFEAASSPRRLMIAQHLFLGMNAHINLDLGVAAAEVGRNGLPALYADFIRVNEILFQILDRLQGGLGSVSPRMSLLDKLCGGSDEWLMRMGIRTARDLAWNLATRLCDVSDASGTIAERDADAAWVARAMERGWSPLHLVGRLVAAGESRDMTEIVAALSVSDVDLETAERRASEDMHGERPSEHRLRTAVTARRRFERLPSR